MPSNPKSKYYGNVFGIPTGGPDDDPFTGEYFPSGDSAVGYIRRSLPSDLHLDRMVLHPRINRADGYLPGSSEKEIQGFENTDRVMQRRFVIGIGNATGSFTGPPDRIKK
jgi:hypothetical protein